MTWPSGSRKSALSVLAARSRATGARIEETFSYLEALIAGHLERSVAGFDTGSDIEAEEDDVVTEKLGVREVLAGIHECSFPRRGPRR